jgi:hypothetical protein
VFGLSATSSTDGSAYRWRAFVLKPDRWHRLAVPLGAFEPLESAAGDASILTDRVTELTFGLARRGTRPDQLEPAALDLDDVLVHHGHNLPPQIDGAASTPREDSSSEKDEKTR